MSNREQASGEVAFPKKFENHLWKAITPAPKEERGEAIRKQAEANFDREGDSPTEIRTFIEGAEWADENPATPSPALAKAVKRAWLDGAIAAQKDMEACNTQYILKSRTPEALRKATGGE